MQRHGVGAVDQQDDLFDLSARLQLRQLLQHLALGHREGQVALILAERRRRVRLGVFPRHARYGKDRGVRIGGDHVLDAPGRSGIEIAPRDLDGVIAIICADRFIERPHADLDLPVVSADRLHCRQQALIDRKAAALQRLRQRHLFVQHVRPAAAAARQYPLQAAVAEGAHFGAFLQRERPVFVPKQYGALFVDALRHILRIGAHGLFMKCLPQKAAPFFQHQVPGGVLHRIVRLKILRILFGYAVAVIDQLIARHPEEGIDPPGMVLGDLPGDDDDRKYDGKKHREQRPYGALQNFIFHPPPPSPALFSPLP